MEYKKDRYEMAIEMLRKTNDGDDLTEADLKVVELGVNDFLSEEGIKYFNSLYDRIKNPKGE